MFMSTRPSSPDPSGTSSGDQANPFAGLGAGLGAGMDFFQDWMKAAGSALPHLQGSAGSGTPGMPAWTMPTLDPAELDKRIQDLKTVQFWLEQNARMIAMSIQGLEVQRMTLSTLQGMNVSMDALRESLKARPEAPAPQPEPKAAPAPAAASSWASRWPSPAAPAAAPAAPPPAAPAAATDESDAGSDDKPAYRAASADDKPAAEGADLINPMRWWDTLTQQFTHLASQAAQTVGDSVGGSMDLLKQAQSGLAQAAPGAGAATGKKAAATGQNTNPAGRPKAAGKKAASKKTPGKAGAAAGARGRHTSAAKG
jgi:hypothetical protein